MERRWGNRVTLALPVRVDGDDGAIGLALLSDLSLSGGFIRTGLRLPELARVCVELQAIRANGASRRQRHATPSDTEQLIEAFVVRSTQAGLALEWCDFAPPGIVRIVRHRGSIAPVEMVHPVALAEPVEHWARSRERSAR